MREIRINAPGAGDWVMSRVGGRRFTPGHDNSFTTHRDGEILGGFVLCDYIGGSLTVHMAGDDKRWCSKELLWLVFHYAFEQVGCTKMIAPLPSNDPKVLAMDMRAGWQLETAVTDVYGPGIHMMVLTMTKDECPWLKYTPRYWRPGRENLAVAPVAGSA
jgi:hypothetical protein